MKKTTKLTWIGRIISGLAILPFIPSGVMKLLHHPSVIKGLAHLELPESWMTPLGILELSCVTIYLFPRTAVLGSILLTGYLGGAILTHLRIGEPIFLHIGLGVLLWLGLYLREQRLREILPLRNVQDPQSAV